VRCYRRAVSCGDSEGIALTKLAKLHQELREEDAAALFWKGVLQVHDDEQTITSQEVVDALTFTAQYCLKKADSNRQEDVDAIDNKSREFLVSAYKCCERLLDCPIPEKEEAKVLLSEIEKRLLVIDGSADL